MKGPVSSSPTKDLTRVLRTLSDETRLRLLRLLALHELSVGELASITQLAQPRISNHLKILREEELITERREGARRLYRVDTQSKENPAAFLWTALEHAWEHDDQFAGDDKRLTEILAARQQERDLDFFDTLAERWDEYRDQMFGDALGREILKTFLPPGLVVADIGTGTGYVLRLFGERAKKLIAVDRSEGMLAIARENAEAEGLGNVEFRLADISARPLKTTEADLVTIVQVLHHLKDPAAAIHAVAPGIKPGGMLIVNDFLDHQENWLISDLKHEWRGFRRIQIEEWVRSAGLQPAAWAVLPGKLLPESNSHRLRVPDGFTLTARKPS